MLDFFKEHLGVVISIIFVIVGFLGLKKKAYKAGDKLGDLVEDNISGKARQEIGEFVVHFAEGLKGEAYNGDGNLISNEQIDKKLKKVKIDLGLRE